ncbi:MAG: hypothetical protein IJN25_06575 [Clostridia bacterium]|nr:hypothetical protein [Oscillospiraceae bacterium]MBQ7033303.1 hypothetical protein [Clostridia bacterium]
MVEGFYESMVRHIKTPKEHLVDVGLALAGILGGIVVFVMADLMSLHAIGIAGALAAVFFGFRAVLFNNWEYEYIVTDGAVDIDQIIARRKRKRMLTFDCRDCEIIAPLNRGNYYADYKSLPVQNFTAYTEHEDNFFAVIVRGGVRTCILFQPTEDMVHQFKAYNSRNVFIS